MFLLFFPLPGTHPLAEHEEQMGPGEHFPATSADFSEGLQAQLQILDISAGGIPCLDVSSMLSISSCLFLQPYIVLPTRLILSWSLDDHFGVLQIPSPTQPFPGTAAQGEQEQVPPGQAIEAQRRNFL